MFGPVLGIDPGVSRCGYGAVSEDGGRFQAGAWGVIRTPPNAPLPERLAQLMGELEALMAEVRPVAVAVERLFFQANVRTAMSVGQASGLALALAARAGVAVHQYTPNEVKQAVAGYGAAGKAQVQAMVTRLLRLPATPKPPDAADALALAVCHLSAGRFRAATGQAGTGAGPATAPGLARAIEGALARGSGPPRMSTRGAGSPHMSTGGAGSPRMSTGGAGSPRMSTGGAGSPRMSTGGAGSPRMSMEAP